MKRPIPLLALLLVLAPSPAHSFCGFYVAAGDAKLYNHASQVVLARDGDRTVITMASDYKGDAKDFALVVPVPTVIQKDQVHIGDITLVQRIDGWSAPRLVEYNDPPPCQVPSSVNELRVRAGRGGEVKFQFDGVEVERPAVRIEARFTVGEYDIVVLSADQSHALLAWLRDNGYRVPGSAAKVVGAYLKQGMKFFVARVNLKEQQKLGFASLRPIQIAYESPKFMLPIRLGMTNGDGAQDLLVYTLTRTGRVECTNFRTVKLPTDVDVPEFAKTRFADFYRALFDQQSRKEGIGVVFTEYAWDMGWCDPCASPPLSPDEQRKLGAFWLDASGMSPASTFCTRLHVRYDAAHFPEDLVFQQTPDRVNWQARYVLHHPWQGSLDCPGGEAYRAQLRERRRNEAENLQRLTGWSAADIKRQMAVSDDWSKPIESMTWYQRLWQTVDQSGASR
ncbi:MAG TPA: DUF2330 domain-containing protein [Candidatus Udaeobacter sp.]|jgi:hypothetical protein|nr:DUF2330 domain-containing protein [Candidatus Udaeobacter sp.]